MKKLGFLIILIGAVFLLTHLRDANLRLNSRAVGENNFDAQALNKNFANMPIVFEENRGQTDKRVKFLSRGTGYMLFLTGTEAVMTLRKEKNELAVLRMKTIGGNTPVKIEGKDEQTGKSNYLLGADEQKWQRDVPNFGKVRYEEVYDGVDLVYYGNGRDLEYDFVVAPRANPNEIAVKFEGAKKISLGAEGDLLLEVEGGVVRQNKPFIYQETNGERQQIAGNYVLKNETEIGFEIGEYDRSKPLVIDPTLVYGTYLGSREYEISNGIAVDAAGNSYLTGYALPPTFPTTPGSVRPAVDSNNLTPFVAKFNPTGTTLLYSTYLGGAGEGIAVDAAGNAYTTGYPHPELGFTPTPGALDMGRGGIGVTKLNPQGNQRIYAARFGSSGTDTAREIAIDPQGNAVVIGLAGCFTSCDFPILNAAQPTPPSQGGGGFVAKLNATGSALVYSTYLGTGTEELWGVDTDAAGNAYVTGNTISFNFPTTPGAFDRTFACPQPPFCNTDSFVTKIPSAGGAYAYSTYLGGRGSERGWTIAVDNVGNAYAAGYTDGRFSGFPDEGFPTTPGAFKMFGSSEAYVTKFNADGSALVYSTLLGGEGGSCGEERARDIDVDRLGFAYVVGLTTCDNFPLANPLQSAPSSFAAEAFVTKLNQTGSALVYSSYLGGPRYDEAYSVAVDRTGAAYITGTTSGDFQHITPGAYDTTWNCPNGNCQHPDDIFVIKISGDILSSGRTFADFDGDGRADISVFRPSEANWYVSRSTGGFFTAHWGISTDKLAPADFDGDGKTDIAVYRDGVWYWINSQNGSIGIVQFGAAGDIPLPADFDGDGRAELSVYRSGVWWTLNFANNQTSTVQFGFSTDKPVAADYDGDGKADIAIFRPDSGQWWIQRSSSGSVYALQFGTATDKIVPADYTGDGKTDIAVFRPSNGFWYILRSEDNSFYAFPFGTNGDVPVAADFDGDGKTDAAVFRGGIWYLQRSTAGFTALQFGLANDTPVSSAYVR